MPKVRESNIELLRIISMIMILVVHFDGAALGLPYFFEPWNVGVGVAGYCAKQIIEAIAIIGVNCFVLISGYFGIRFSIVGLLKFTFWCLFYSVVVFAVKGIFSPDILTADNILAAFLVFSHTDLWFIPAYLVLYLLSPLINAGIKDMKKPTMRWLIVALMIVNCYLGWLWGGSVNPTGYNAMQLIFIYFVGRYIGIYVKDVALIHYASAIVFYLLSTAMIVVSSVWLPSRMAFAYNSPFVIAASVSFFMIFIGWRFKSRIVNWIASSVFAVYLIHKNPYIWVDLSHYIKRLSVKQDYLSFTLSCIAIIVAIFIVSVVTDKVRMWISTIIFRKRHNHSLG